MPPDPKLPLLPERVAQERYDEAWRLLEHGHFADAQATFEHLLTHDLDRRLQADVRSGLAGTLHLQGRSMQALSELHRALALREELQDDMAVASTYNNLGILSLELGNLALAAEHLENARSLLSGQPDHPLFVPLLCNLARTHLDHGDLGRAEQYAREGLALVGGPPDRQSVALHLNLAESLLGQGELQEARAHLHSACQGAARIEAQDLLMRARHGTALALEQEGRLEAAITVMDEVLLLARDAQDNAVEILCTLGLARLELQAGRPASALDHARAALRTCWQAGRRLMELETHDLLCRILSSLGEHVLALEHVGEARQLERELRNDDNEQRLMILNMRHDVERVKHDRAAAWHATHLAETKIREQLAELQRLALYDTLTGLPNRTLLTDRLRQWVGTGRPVTVGLLNLKRFRQINLTYGQASGDALLAHVAMLLSTSLQDGETASRPGGAEFLLLMHSGDGPAAVAARVQAALERTPMNLDGREYWPEMALGLATFPDDSMNAETLLKHADLALHHALTTDARWALFHPDLTSGTMTFESELQTATREQQWELHHQPQIHAGTGHVLGVEALLRWRHPVRGLVPPAEFIPALEDSNLIVEVGAWVLTEACRQIAPLGDLRVSVNVSARQFLNGTSLIGAVQGALRDSGLPASRLELELTESQVMRNPEYAVGVLQALRALGVRVSIDDFGTGHSSFAYLRQFPLDALKIDRAFVRELAGDRRDRAIVETIAHLAHGLGLEVVAEGIETERQAEITREIGVDLLQGYLFGRPLPLADLKAYLNRCPGEDSAPVAATDSPAEPPRP